MTVVGRVLLMHVCPCLGLDSHVINLSFLSGLRSLEDKQRVWFISLLHAHGQPWPLTITQRPDPETPTNPRLSWENAMEQQPQAKSAQELLLGTYRACLSMFMYSRDAHTSQAFPMCKKATSRPSGRRFPCVIHQSLITMSHLCYRTI